MAGILCKTFGTANDDGTFTVRSLDGDEQTFAICYSRQPEDTVRSNRSMKGETFVEAYLDPTSPGEGLVGTLYILKAVGEEYTVRNNRVIARTEPFKWSMM